MKKVIITLAIALTGTSLAQSLTVDQQGAALTHINEIAGEIGLLGIVCPLNEPAPFDAPTLFCFIESFSSADTFRMGWDLYTGFAAPPVRGLAPWALDADTSSVSRTFALDDGLHYTIVFQPESEGGRVWVGAHLPR